VRKISDGRLRDAERRTPKPFEPLLIVRTIVGPNGPGGCNGPPIQLGVASRTRTIPGGSIEEIWPEPWPQLADLPEYLMVRERWRRIKGVGIVERFSPPVAEPSLPDGVDYEAVERHKRFVNHTGKFAPPVAKNEGAGVTATADEPAPAPASHNMDPSAGTGVLPNDGGDCGDESRDPRTE